MIRFVFFREYFRWDKGSVSEDDKIKVRLIRLWWRRWGSGDGGNILMWGELIWFEVIGGRMENIKVGV